MIFWLGFVAIMTLVIIISFIIPALLFISIFWGAGLFMLYFVVNQISVGQIHITPEKIWVKIGALSLGGPKVFSLANISAIYTTQPKIKAKGQIVPNTAIGISAGAATVTMDKNLSVGEANWLVSLLNQYVQEYRG